MNSDIKFTVISCVVVMAAVFLLVSYYAINSGGTKTFVYTWTKEEQEIVNGTFRLEISFQWKSDVLNVIAKINCSQSNKPDDVCLGLVFDINGNGELDYGTIDEPYMFLPSNITLPADFLPKPPGISDETDKGCYLIPQHTHEPLKPSLHTCTFSKDTGWTYNISIPKSKLLKVKANVVYILIIGNTYHHGSLGRWWDWVTAKAEGWM